MALPPNAVKDGIVIGGPNLVGSPVDRVDGKSKVTGAAKYAAEFTAPRMAHAYAFTSTIAKGRVQDIDTVAAQNAPGVIVVITHQNAPRINRLSRNDKKLVGLPGQTMPVLQDDAVHYAGQYLGLVVAETFEQAQFAARLVKIKYAEESFLVDPERSTEIVVPDKMGRGDKPDKSRGDPDAALASAEIKVRQTYRTAVENHNPMELSATLAQWDGDHLTLHDATQHVYGARSIVAAYLGINEDNIRVIDPFVGGGFGCKGSTWPHVYLAAIAARQVGRPVRLIVTRQQMFAQVGHRPQTIQKISLGAAKDGKLTAITHDVTNETSDFDEWTEPSAKQTSFLYSCPNVRTTHRLARVNVGTPCQMRAPGEATGTAVFEIAMDELAYAASVDPLELRLRNYAQTDEGEAKPYSSKSLRECYKLGSERFGWDKRPMQPRSLRDGETLIGWGMATATYPTNRSPATAMIRLMPNGTVIVATAAHDLGTGTYTILSQIAAQTLGLPIDRIRTEIGDTRLPKSPVAGGSQQAASSGSAVLAAAHALVANLAQLAAKDSNSPLAGRKPEEVIAGNGRLILRKDPAVGEPIMAAFSRNGRFPIFATADSGPGEEKQKYSQHAWGAQFAEVRVDSQLGEIRVSRFVGAFAAGEILNLKTAHSQVMGGMVMGIGMALLEQTIHDPSRGKIVNDNLADYLVPVNPDVPDIDCFFVEERDEFVNPLGSKGVGELGITGAAAAVANAVFHATGKRIRDLPITLDRLLDMA
jgi:xanthine dehydrogenase YagR molybdenum-binding subunit